MTSPERFSNLPEYAFPRLRALLATEKPGGPVRRLTIGEPQHPFPEWVPQVLAENMAGFGRYPSNEGSDALRGAISGWLGTRHDLDIGPDQICSLNGTREGLFNAALALCPKTKAGQRPAILIPNPFYQVYAVAAAALDAEAVFVTADEATDFLPDYAGLDAAILDRTAIVYLCSPANPQGAVAGRDYLTALVALAEAHDFLIFSDECYSEIWRDTPPLSALAVAEQLGLGHRVVMFNSLSKRSNLPGLRSGFAAGSRDAIARLSRLRAYSGAPVPGPLQAVSARAWSDEDHVIQNRARYLEKYEIADRIFADYPGYTSPQGGFFLWLPVENGEATALRLWRDTGLQVLPGSYLARDTPTGNPGQNRIRVALVAPADETEAALRLLINNLRPEN